MKLEFAVFWAVAPCSVVVDTNVLDNLTSFIFRVEIARSSAKTLVFNRYTTRSNNTENSEF